MTDKTDKRRVAVVGGGLAGLAAALRLAEAGVNVELFEARRWLGGRAASFQDPTTGEIIDHCQHVSMGCCTAFLDFIRRAGIDSYFRRDRVLHFIGPDGRQFDLAASRWLPAPAHLLPALMRLGFLSWRERLGIVRAMRQLFAWRLRPGETEPTIANWLRQQGQSQRAIDWFWSVVLVSALGASIERCSIVAAQTVFVHGFAAKREGYELIVPSVPLGELYDRIARRLIDLGVVIHIESPVTGLELTGSRVAVGVNGVRRNDFDAVAVAVPWNRLANLFTPDVLASWPQIRELERIESAAIAAVHLWYDRPITPLPYAVLIGRLSQWMFQHGERTLPDEQRGYYYQVVISGADSLAVSDQQTIAARVIEELAAIWPAAKVARVLHQRVVTQRQAVFCYAPGIDRIRPTANTPLENLFLAGDWTATGWPATMESAIRSGDAAATAVLARPTLLRQGRAT